MGGECCQVTPADRDIELGRLEAESRRLVDDGKTPMYLAVDTTAAGIIAIANTVKGDSLAAIKALKGLGLEVVILALMSAIVGEAEAVVISEVKSDPENIVAELRSAYDRGKQHGLVVVAEGANYNAEGLVRYFREHRQRLGFELRVIMLGHVQRGGAPTAFDRLLATRFGAAATGYLAEGRYGVLAGLVKGEVGATPWSRL